MKVALIHDWLIDRGGAEGVLQVLLSIYPNADVFTLVCGMDEKQLAALGINKPVKTSFLQRMPFVRKKYRNYFPLMPLAIQQFELQEYDLIISSNFCVAKGVITGPDQLHVCYCHSPVRYAWDLQAQYLKESKNDKGIKSWILRYLLNGLRDFDARSSLGVDKFIANSSFIQRRIQKCYRRESVVIYPPVETTEFTLSTEKDDYYLVCSRLVQYKKVGLIVDAFNLMPDKKLLVLGGGPDYQQLQKKAGKNITLAGYVSRAELIEKMRKAKAFIHAAEEDFGIAPVEAQACGTPVIGYGKGGLLDTVAEGKTGIYFNKQTPESVCEAVARFENSTLLLPEEIANFASSFSVERFKMDLLTAIGQWLLEHRGACISKATQVFERLSVKSSGNNLSRVNYANK
jgi:glycosyltransferase involved in cell wall biosynthesis